jgi:hypothetical protein
MAQGFPLLVWRNNLPTIGYRPMAGIPVKNGGLAQDGEARRRRAMLPRPQTC